MNKKVLGFALTIFFLAMLAAPVIAVPATKVEGVTAIMDFVAIPGSQKLVDHGIQQTREGVSIGTVTLNIPEQDALIGTLTGEWIGTVKFSQFPPDPNAEAVIRAKAVWAFTGEGTTGTFEGVSHSKWIGFPTPFMSYISYHMVLQGTGDFEGQTLKLSCEGAPPPVLEGYLVIPK